MDMHDSVSVSVSPHSFSFLDFSTPDSSIFFSMPSLYRITLQMPCSILALFSFQGTGGGRQGVEEGGMFYAKLQPIKFFISFFFFFFYFSFFFFFIFFKQSYHQLDKLQHPKGELQSMFSIDHAKTCVYTAKDIYKIQDPSKYIVVKAIPV